jgi:hypothetical protein
MKLTKPMPTHIEDDIQMNDKSDKRPALEKFWAETTKKY